jgi:hypothetical protein
MVYRPALASALIAASILLTPSVQAASIADTAEASPPDPAAHIILNLPADREARAAQGWQLAQNEPTPDIAGPRAPLADQQVQRQPYGLSTFGRDIGTVGWEAAAVALELTAARLPKVIRNGESFSFSDDHFFGQKSFNLGMDKVVHGYKAYVLADIFQQMIERKTGDRTSAAFTSAILTFGFMVYGEMYDGFHQENGFSYKDKIASMAGIGVSLLRNTVPGLEDKFDIRQLRRNTGRFSEQKYLVAFQLSGFKAFENSPLRFVELQSGYYVNGFTREDRARGEVPRRHFFFGVGLNLQELFFKERRSKPANWAWTALNYIQVPYTAAYVKD